LVVAAACVAIPAAKQPIELAEDTLQLHGWLVTRVDWEWELFPRSDIENYDPFVNDDSQRCVTLLNRTGLAADDYHALHGRKVVVWGTALRYDALKDGENDGDRVLAKKYYNEHPIQNFCYRDLLFVVTRSRRDRLT
jgi:hypothetical protein